MKPRPARIDSHQHFWNYSPEEYEWMSQDSLAPLRYDRLPEDLKALQTEVGYAGSVAVQARQKVEESAWLLALADQHPEVVLGVVGWLDLRSRDVVDQLAEFAAHPRFKGVRHVVQDEVDPNFMLGKDFQNGIAQLSDFKLTYDILIFPHQLDAAIGLAREFPEQPFVLDHVAKPVIRDGEMEPWRTKICELANHQNVHCKISGMVTEATWDSWKPEDLDPYMDIVVEAFSPSRLMVGTDWPVCTLAASYQEVTGYFNQYFSTFSEDEKDRIFSRNVYDFYSLQS